MGSHLHHYHSPFFALLLVIILYTFYSQIQPISSTLIMALQKTMNLLNCIHQYTLVNNQFHGSSINLMMKMWSLQHTHTHKTFIKIFSSSNLFSITLQSCTNLSFGSIFTRKILTQNEICDHLMIKPVQ